MKAVAAAAAATARTSKHAREGQRWLVLRARLRVKCAPVRCLPLYFGGVSLSIGRLLVYANAGVLCGRFASKRLSLRDSNPTLQTV